MTQKQFAPLSALFTLASMLGFVISVLFVAKWDVTYGFTFAIIFACMFVASMQSMRHANPDDMLHER